MMKHFKFEREKADVINEKSGKVMEYKVVHSIGHTEQNARQLANLTDDYLLVAIYPLSKYW